MSETTTTLPIADTTTEAREARICYGVLTYPVRAHYPTAMGTVTALAYRIETRITSLRTMGVVVRRATVTDAKSLYAEIHGMMDAFAMLTESEFAYPEYTPIVQAMRRDLRSARTEALARIRSARSAR